MRVGDKIDFDIVKPCKPSENRKRIKRERRMNVSLRLTSKGIHVTDVEVTDEISYSPKTTPR